LNHNRQAWLNPKPVGPFGYLALPLQYLNRKSKPIELSLFITMSEYKNIITIEPGKRGGKPCVRGMRITVGDVLGWLASGMSHKEIIEDFPELTDEDILACLSYG
jgi:uncharacterized protein (DUF433 family)